MKRFLKLLCKVLILLGLAALALVLVFPPRSSVPIWIPMAGMDALLFGIAVKDLQEERIPNLVTYPLMFAGVVRGPTSCRTRHSSCSGSLCGSRGKLISWGPVTQSS